MKNLSDRELRKNPLAGIADELFDDDPREYALALMRTEGASAHSAAARAHNRFGGGYDKIYAAILQEPQ